MLQRMRDAKGTTEADTYGMTKGQATATTEADLYGMTTKGQATATATDNGNNNYNGKGRDSSPFEHAQGQNDGLFGRCGNLFVVGMTMLFCWSGVIKWSLLVLFLVWFERIRERF
jgi:hypothetical protein